MARYVLGEKFWEIERDGATIIRRSGKVGTKGRAQSRTFENALVARFQYKHFVGYKTWTEKYVLTTPDPPRLRDLGPDDDDARLVFADALQAKGDPVGELIALQHAWHQSKRDDIAKAIVEFATKHEALLFGDLACARDLFLFEWHLGRLRKVKLGYAESASASWFQKLEAIFPEVPLVYRLDTLLEALFDLDIARAVDELILTSKVTRDFQSTLKTLVEMAPPTLRRLEINRQPGEGVIWPLALPALEEFECNLELCGLGLRQLSQSTWPKLRSLSFAMQGYDEAAPYAMPSDDDAIAELAPLLTGQSMPALQYLEISTPSPARLCTALADGALLYVKEIVIRSKRAMHPSYELELQRSLPNARFDQQPLYSMRPRA